MSGLGQILEPMPLLRLGRRVQLRDLNLREVELALVRSAIPLGGVDRRNVGSSGGFRNILSVDRASVRGMGDSRPYHSYCIGEASRIDQRGH